MRRLVDPKGAAFFTQTMPATEVVGAVARVQIPREIDRRDATDLTREDQFLDLLVLRRGAIVEGDDNRLTRFAFRVQHHLTLLLVDHHWFFGDDVDAAL